jgi:hypothetical protein
MMTGTVGIIPELPFASVVQAADTGATVSVNLADSSKKSFQPGDTFTVTCDVTDNADGFSALNAYVTYNKKAFSIEKWEYGTDDEDDELHQNISNPTKSKSKYQNPDANLDTLIQLYVDQSATNLTGDQKLSKITFKVLDGASGDYKIEIGGDPVLQNGKKVADQNRIVVENGEKTPLELTPTYKSLTVSVGSAPAATEAASPSPAVTEAKVTDAASPSPAVTEAKVTDAASPSPAVTEAKVTDAPPAADAIIIEAGEISGKAGDKVKLVLTAKNVGEGFSALQFDYDLNKDFTVKRGIKGDFEGSWTVGEKERSVQFLEQEGMNISGDGVIGKLEIQIPADAKDGVYDFKISNIEGSMVDSSTGKQVKIESSKFASVAGKVIVGEPVVTDAPATPAESPSPAVTDPEVQPSTPVLKEQVKTESEVKGGLKGPKVDAGKYTVEKAGDEVKIKVKVSDVTDGFNALNTWLDVDTDIFEIVSVKGGDTDDEENEDSLAYSNVSTNKFHKDGAADNITTVLCLYSDTSNADEDMVLSTITLKVKEGTKDGVYSLPFDAKGDGGAMANRIVTADGERKPVILNPTYLGALIQVGKDEPVVTTEAKPAETTAAKPAETTAAKPAETTAAKPAETTEAKPAETTEAKPAETTAAKPAETTAVTTAKVEDPKSDAIQIEIGEVNGEAGKTVKVPVYAKNVGKGFSSIQFNYEMNETFTIKRGIKGDFDGSWTIGSKERAVQFLEQDGMNISGDGCIGKFEVVIPAGTPDGIYEIVPSGFEGSQVDPDTNKQQILEGSAFAGVAGRIIIGDVDPNVTTAAEPAETTEAKPAETTEAKPAETTEAKPAETTEAKPAETTEAKPAETTEAKPAETTEAKPAETTAVTTEAKPAETTAEVAPSPATPVDVEGDVDDNGVVNTRDLIALKRFLLLQDKKAPANADVNGDKSIDSLDLVHLLKILLK